MNYQERFLEFIKDSVTPFHAVKNLSLELEKNGYEKLVESRVWDLKPEGKYYVLKNDSSIIAFEMPKTKDELNFNIIASHTDSPTFKIKPNHDIKTASKTLALNVEAYGGGIYSTWLDKPLGIAGRVCYLDDNKITSKLIKMENICVIPNLAIHMNRSINTGYNYNVATDMCPLYGSSDSKPLKDLIKEDLNLSSDPLGLDLYLYNMQRGNFIGRDKLYFVAPQIDNLESAYSTLLGFLEGHLEKGVKFYCSFDNEEVGSGTKQGALSTFMLDVMERIMESFNLSFEEKKAAIASSFLVSCDNAHAIHPNQPGISDKENHPYMNEGVVIKVNANQSYTTDALSRALFVSILDKAGIKHQNFANRSDQRGGSTLGRLALEQVSIDSVDIGLAQLAMHSSMETAGSLDVESLVKASKAFYSTHLTKDANNNFILK